MKLYLCGVFAPYKPFFFDQRGTYAERARWIHAKNSIEAHRIYGRRYGEELNFMEKAHVRVLSIDYESGEVKDGDTGSNLALHIMDKYYFDHPECRSGGTQECQPAS